MDNLTATIAAAVAEHIDYDHLAARIAAHLRTQAAAIPYDYDAPVEYAQARAELGGGVRRGLPISYPTFQKYIRAGRLTTISGPNGAKKYVRRGDLDILKKESKKKESK